MNYQDKIRIMQEIKLSVYLNIIGSLFEENPEFKNMLPRDRLQLHTIMRYINKLENKYVG